MQTNLLKSFIDITKIEITWQQPELKDITPQVVAGANGLARVKEFEK